MSYFCVVKIICEYIKIIYKEMKLLRCVDGIALTIILFLSLECLNHIPLLLRILFSLAQYKILHTDCLNLLCINLDPSEGEIYKEKLLVK